MATAVEIEPAPRAPQPFWQGVCLGVAGTATGAHLLLTHDLPDLARTYRDFGNAPIPLGTVITISDAWRWGVFGVGVAMVASLAWLRPRHLAWYAAAALALVAAVLATWWFPTAPLRELAGAIRE